MFFKRLILKKIKNKIKRIKDRYMSINKNEKDKIVSIMQHDIKTPLIAQINSLEFILKNNENFNNIQNEFLVQNLNSNYFLLNLVENLIYLLKFKGNNEKLETKKINLFDEIEKSYAKIENYAKEKQQEIIFNNIENISYNANQNLISKLITNILSTSILSSDDNSKIEVSLKESEKDILFCAKSKTLFMSKEKIKNLEKNKNEFDTLGINLNYDVIKTLLDYQNWKIIASSKEESCELGFVIKK